MINRVYLDVNKEKVPAVFRWSEEEQDYVFEQMPQDLTRSELSELVDEVKRITGW